jgi:integrase
MDAGLRSGELHRLRAGGFADSKYSLKLHVGSGKTGERSIDLILSIPYVRKWLDDHPARHVADAPLWTTESSTPNDYEEIAYHSFYEVFERAALRADVTKPYTPTNFRKSNAAWLARTNAPQSFIEDRQARARGGPSISVGTSPASVPSPNASSPN